MKIDPVSMIMQNLEDARTKRDDALNDVEACLSNIRTSDDRTNSAARALMVASADVVRYSGEVSALIDASKIAVGFGKE